TACLGGVPSYSAWYEFFPKGAMTIHSMTVNPGDTMFGEVSASSSGQFNLTLVDLTTSHSFTKLGKVKGAQLSSAEWIAEAPSSSTGILPLANFGRVYFGQDLTGVAGTCETRVNGVTGTIGAFRSHAVQITMLSRNLTVKAGTSPLSPDTSSFIVQWFYSGP
ncbi:MAG TPA: G1 family glutamic endopeptidase, partial [Candidatus Binatus sp.]|nr:G1 family glutamic endopeptidase [Candidatus Binatus sp.]